MYDDVGGEAFNGLLLWIEDVGLRELLDNDGGRGNPGRYVPIRSPDTDLTKSTGVPPVQPIGVLEEIGCG